MRVRIVLPILVVMVLGSVVISAASGASGSSSSSAAQSPTSLAVASDCNAPIPDRLDAAAKVQSATEQQSRTAVDVVASIRESLRYVRICNGEVLKLGENPEVVPAKEAGAPVPASYRLDLGPATVQGSCTYTAWLAQWAYTRTRAKSVIARETTNCPVVATMRMDPLCVQKRFSNGNHASVGCGHFYDPNWTANLNWTRSTDIDAVVCDPTVDYRTQAHPERFANGSWAGPGTIYSASWRSGSGWC